MRPHQLIQKLLWTGTMLIATGVVIYFHTSIETFAVLIVLLTLAVTLLWGGAEI